MKSRWLMANGIESVKGVTRESGGRSGTSAKGLSRLFGRSGLSGGSEREKRDARDCATSRTG